MPGSALPQRPDGRRLSDPGRTRPGRHGRGLRGRADLAGPPRGPEDPAGAGVGRSGGFSERLGNVCSPTLARFGRIDRSQLHERTEWPSRCPGPSWRRSHGSRRQLARSPGTVVRYRDAPRIVRYFGLARLTPAGPRGICLMLAKFPPVGTRPQRVLDPDFRYLGGDLRFADFVARTHGSTDLTSDIDSLSPARPPSETL
jgi:hypothetical protein